MMVVDAEMADRLGMGAAVVESRYCMGVVGLDTPKAAAAAMVASLSVRNEECCAGVDDAQLRGCTESTCTRDAGKGCSSDAVSVSAAGGGKTAEVRRSFDPGSLVRGACAKAPVLVWRMSS